MCVCVKRELESFGQKNISALFSANKGTGFCIFLVPKFRVFSKKFRAREIRYEFLI